MFFSINPMLIAKMYCLKCKIVLMGCDSLLPKRRAEQYLISVSSVDHSTVSVCSGPRLLDSFCSFKLIWLLIVCENSFFKNYG